MKLVIKQKFSQSLSKEKTDLEEFEINRSLIAGSTKYGIDFALEKIKKDNFKLVILKRNNKETMTVIERKIISKEKDFVYCPLVNDAHVVTTFSIKV